MFFHFEGNAHVPNVELRLGTNFPLHSLMMKLDLPTAASPASTILYILSGSREALEEPMDWKENQNAMRYLRPRIYQISVLDRKYGFKFYLSEKAGGSISKGGRVHLKRREGPSQKEGGSSSMKFEFTSWLAVIRRRRLFLLSRDLRLAREDLMLGAPSRVCSCSARLSLGNTDSASVSSWDSGSF